MFFVLLFFAEFFWSFESFEDLLRIDYGFVVTIKLNAELPPQSVLNSVGQFRTLSRIVEDCRGLSRIVEQGRDISREFERVRESSREFLGFEVAIKCNAE